LAKETRQGREKGGDLNLEPDLIYLVQSPDDDSVLLAMDAKINNDLIEWFDSSRDRAFEITGMKSEDDCLIVQTEDTSYTFRELSLELYQQKVVDKVIGSLKFTSTDELQDYYRNYVR
jgi:hypothetical protein